MDGDTKELDKVDGDTREPTPAFAWVVLNYWFLVYAMLSFIYLFLWVFTWVLAFFCGDWTWGLIIFIAGCIPISNLVIALPFSVAYLVYRGTAPWGPNGQKCVGTNLFPRRDASSRIKNL